jgi:cytochrome c biogenesis protein CcmG/thiol:disulfide interchange protein DsbE
MTMASPSPEPPRRRAGRRRTVLWIAGGVGVAFAVLIAFLATLGSAPSASTSTTAGPLKGKPAPALSGRLLGGTKTVSLSQFAGKWVLVNFAASWCVPCQQEMPQLLKFAKTAPRYHAVLLTVAEDPSDVAHLHTFMVGNHATWPTINAGTAPVTWGVVAPPTTYIVDPEGIVVGELLDGVNATAIDTAITRASRPAAT